MCPRALTEREKIVRKCNLKMSAEIFLMFIHVYRFFSGKLSFSYIFGHLSILDWCLQVLFLEISADTFLMYIYTDFSQVSHFEKIIIILGLICTRHRSGVVVDLVYSSSLNTCLLRIRSVIVWLKFYCVVVYWLIMSWSMVLFLEME